MNIAMNKLLGTMALSALLTTGLTGIAAAQTSTDLNATDTGTTIDNTGTDTTPLDQIPGAPNTGAGGDAAINIAVLSLSALIAAGGLAYIARAR